MGHSGGSLQVSCPWLIIADLVWLIITCLVTLSQNFARNFDAQHPHTVVYQSGYGASTVGLMTELGVGTAGYSRRDPVSEARWAVGLERSARPTAGGLRMVGSEGV
jgi:hypothetical protein